MSFLKEIWASLGRIKEDWASLGRIKEDDPVTFWASMIGFITGNAVLFLTLMRL